MLRALGVDPRYGLHVEARLGLLHKVTRSTLTLTASIPSSHPSAAVLGTSRSGTGCLVDDDGHILTVNYVVLGASVVNLTDGEGRSIPAELIAQDFATGVAVVRAAADVDIIPLPPGDSRDLEMGEPLFIVASAGEGERRANSGVVTSVEPFDAYWEYRLERAVWTTCVNPGLGGGPVCNRFGEVVGVTSLNLGAIGRATLAIPAENYFDYADELLAHGHRTSRPKRPWLGVFCYALPGRTVVAGLIPGAPAEDCGLEVGDVIATVDGLPVQARAELYEHIWRHNPGDVVRLDVYREGKMVSVPVRSTDVEDFFG
jgi:serine protease Do